uniref:Uncharacterized protein n=2 Tax=Cacopsylla melanoneura TaxID=428564 RepID=A0A8D9B722_9HEMI
MGTSVQPDVRVIVRMNEGDARFIHLVLSGARSLAEVVANHPDNSTILLQFLDHHGGGCHRYIHRSGDIQNSGGSRKGNSCITTGSTDKSLSTTEQSHLAAVPNPSHLVGSCQL